MPILFSQDLLFPPKQEANREFNKGPFILLIVDLTFALTWLNEINSLIVRDARRVAMPLLHERVIISIYSSPREGCFVRADKSTKPNDIIGKCLFALLGQGL